MKKKKISIHDIAKQLKVSATTISFVLNGKAEDKGISVDMIKKVHDHIKKVGYKPNMIAQSLRTGKSNIIGMLMEDIADPFFSTIARGVEANAYEHGYKIFYASTENSTEKTRELINTFRSRQVDGYIIAPPPGIEEDIQSLINDHLPVVLFDRYLPALDTIDVIVDNYAGSYEAVKHLLNNGYENIGFVTLDSKQTQMADRLRGYRKALKEKKKLICIQQLPYAIASHESTHIIKKFLQKHTQLDAILFATNYLAIGGLEAIADLGLRVPGDLALVGFDDNTHFRLFRPSITAVAQPVKEIAVEIVKALLHELSQNNKATKKTTIVLPTELIIRNSSEAKHATGLLKELQSA